MARISIRSGTEGPRHDPYSWSEITFTKTDGAVIVFREGGLGYSQFTVNGVQEDRVFDDEYAWNRFLSLTGMTIARAHEIYNERFYYPDPFGSPSMYEYEDDMPRNIPGVDTKPGYEDYVHDTCSDCRGVVCGFVHEGQWVCDCGDGEYEAAQAYLQRLNDDIQDDELGDRS